MPSYPIVGARYRPPAQAILDNLPAGTKLLLRRQPDNPYDGNAVQVLWRMSEASDELVDSVENILEPYYSLGEDLHRIGFIPRESAAKLAPLLDALREKLKAVEFDDGSPAEWPATLTFAAHGGPMVTFEIPEDDSKFETNLNDGRT